MRPIWRSQITMADETTRPSLELVAPGHKATWKISSNERSCVQQSLFPVSGRALLVVMSPSEGTEQDFLTVLRQACPRFVFDMRLSPRFDFGSLNRKMVFDEIQGLRAQYRDYSAKFRLSGDGDWRLLPKIGGQISELIHENYKKSGSPIVILVEGRKNRDLLARELPRMLKLELDRDWEVFQFPSP